jgi:hypothetical protein
MLKTVLSLVAFTILCGCAATPPTVDYDPSANFANYKTFAYISDHPLLRGEGAGEGSPMLEGRLMQVTENILLARGFSRVQEPESADLAIGFTVGGREKIQVNSYPEPYRAGYGRWGWGGPYYGGSSNVSVHQYTEGTLSIDIYDVKQHRPVWHGRATKTITKKMQENPAETINEIVANILATFPPY